MINIKPLRDNVLGRMVDGLGKERKSTGGVILTDDQLNEDFVRPRWFEVTHIGPDQHDVDVGQYVLVTYGRWSRGVNVEGSLREDDKIFLIDNNDVLGISEENPYEHSQA